MKNNGKTTAPVEDKDASNLDPNLQDSSADGGLNSSADTSSTQTVDDWTEDWLDFGDWDTLEDWDEYETVQKNVGREFQKLRLHMQEIRLRQTSNWADKVAEQALAASQHLHIFQVVAAILLFLGGLWILTRVLLFISGRVFLDQIVSAVQALKTVQVASTLGLVLAYLAPPVFIILLGLFLLGLAVYLIRYRTIQKAVAGISQIQQEMAAGIGVSRPLVQVVQETVAMARQTFVVQLRINQAMFWTGLLLMVVALYRVLVMGDTQLLATSLAGGAGFFSWLVSIFLARDKKIQANLSNVTQLELGLVGLAKQTMILDNWLTQVMENPTSLEKDDFKKLRLSLSEALQKIQESTFSVMGLIELYTETGKDKDTDSKKLLDEAVRKHTLLARDGLDGGMGTALTRITGAYGTVLVKTANLTNIEDLRKAGLSPSARQELSAKTGVRPEVLLEWVQLAELMRVDGMGVELARLLRDSGIKDMLDLAQADPDKLLSNLEAINRKQKLLPVMPTAETVADWVAQAKTLPAEIVYE